MNDSITAPGALSTPAADPSATGGSARPYIVLAIGAAVLTISLKIGAFLLTDSVGLFSDAAESLINLVAALAAFVAVTVAERPADAEHHYGHTKAEYFSSGLEGGLILVAAIAIAVTALNRLVHPEPLENVGLGLAVSLVATVINGGVGLILLRAGRRLGSITLRADGLHLLTDVWTSVGVLVGVLLVVLTGWLVLDPVVALLVALNIAWTAIRLVRESAHGLLDTALPLPEQQAIEQVLARYRAQGVAFHAFRSRTSGRRRFVSMHVLLPGTWTIQRGHDLVERLEADIRQQFPLITVFTHLEPQEDPLSWEDQELDRLAGAGPTSGDPAGKPRIANPEGTHAPNGGRPGRDRRRRRAGAALAAGAATPGVRPLGADPGRDPARAQSAARADVTFTHTHQPKSNDRRAPVPARRSQAGIRKINKNL